MTHIAPHPEDLLEWLKSRYDLPDPVACQLVRSYTNDVYVVGTPAGKFVLKIYGRNWRTEAEIGYEVALLRHLAARGSAVAGPVAGKQGFVNRIEDAAGYRHAVLFEYAKGEKPRPPFTAKLYVAFGRAVARMHELSADFTTEYSRTPLDISHLVGPTLAQVLPLLTEPEDRTFLTDLAIRLEERMDLLASQSLEWGPIHGDATLDNLHLTAEGDVILYDFDSGGPGWRAADLQGWAIHQETYREKWEAFSAGYADVRRLDRVNVLAAPYLTIVWDIWGLKIDLDNRILQQGKKTTEWYLTEQMAAIRTRCEQGDLLKSERV